MGATFRIAGCVALISISAPAIAADKWAIQPVPTGQETVRYDKGVPTLDLEMKDGVVQITPLPLDHGSLSFGVAVYNDGRQPVNMGTENVSVQFGTIPVPVFTRETLEKKAKNRAMWASIALAAAGGLAAYGAASQRNHYRSTFVTPRGTYRSHWSGPSAAGQIQAAAIAAGTGVGIASINNQLDRTLAELGDEIVQTTTVDPGESYAGRIVLAKIKPSKLPARVQVTVNWNGEAYPFTFQIAKRGTVAPLFTAITRQSDLTDFGAGQNVAPAMISPAPTAVTTTVADQAVPAVAPVDPDKKAVMAQVAVPAISSALTTPAPPPTVGTVAPASAIDAPTMVSAAVVQQTPSEPTE